MVITAVHEDLEKALRFLAVVAYCWNVRSDFRFSHTLRVRFVETDPQGVVFNAHYLTYCEVAWAEYFRSIGLEYTTMRSQGFDFAVRHVTADFRSPARLDDVLEIYTRASETGDSSLKFVFDIHRQGSATPLAAVCTIYVCVDPVTFRELAIPCVVKKRIEALEGHPLERKSDI